MKHIPVLLKCHLLFSGLTRSNAGGLAASSLCLLCGLSASVTVDAATWQSQVATSLSVVNSSRAAPAQMEPMTHRDVDSFVADLMSGDDTTQTNPALCRKPPAAAVHINGDLVIRGGSLAILNATEQMENLAVTGALTLDNASQASISGCVKGNVFLQGGGIDDGGHLYSDATIRINQMRNPVNTTLWGRDIFIGQGVSGGDYRAIVAGAYATSVIHKGQVIGTAMVGGRLIPSTVTGGLPWSQGIVQPLARGKIELVMQPHQVWVIDLSKVSIDPVTGQVAHVRAAVTERPPGWLVIPDTLTFKATQIVGGHIQVAQVTTDHLWGNEVNVAGFGGQYRSLWANSDLTLATGQIGHLRGGGDLYASQAGLYWNFPTVDDGDIMGNLYYGAAHDRVDEPLRALPHLRVERPGTSPGLPGRPYCDTQVRRVRVDAFLPHANYIFFRKNHRPYLAIRHVRAADGKVLDGVYGLQENDLRTLHGQPLFACQWKSSQQQGAACFSADSGAKAWIFNGITHFPRGIVWFDGPVIINGTQINDADGNQNLVNTVLARGAVTLTQAGHAGLQAPNYVSAAMLCHAGLYPDNLCESKRDGLTDHGQPAFNSLPDHHLANQALATEDDGTLAGWTISGNVAVGGNFITAANKTTIFGSLRIGSNRRNGVTSINEGGAEIYLPKVLDLLDDSVECSSPPGQKQSFDDRGLSLGG